MASILQNTLNQYWERLTTGWKLGGGVTTKRYLSLLGSVDTEITGGASQYTRTYLSENYTVAKQLRHYQNAYLDNGCIHGKAGLAVGTYGGNATLRNLILGHVPLFFAGKSITAVAGALWSYYGGNKGGAIANTADYCKGVYVDADSDSYNGIKIGSGAALNTTTAGYNFMSLFAHDGSMPGMKAYVGQYTGDATNPHAISVADFGEPDVVIIKGEGAQSAVFRTSNEVYTAGTECDYFVIATASLASQGIESLDANGFTVGTNATVNTNAVKYNYIMLKSDASGSANICLKQFIGQAGDGNHIDLPFKPSFMLFIPGASTTPMMWFNSQTAGSTSYVSAATANVTDAVQSADDYGFTLDGGIILNATNVPCNVIAIEADIT
ncbi:MAG TPA: hypothetical protein DCZ94_21555 [Lentisphaeria bacterium]|nr:MAG: hypothetical protein A2X48_14485 [Lentisphaerae bacterium GWF2_49_21]HBC89532.1 hypothetical protein [Lentisphaeria bacterium]